VFLHAEEKILTFRFDESTSEVKQDENMYLVKFSPEQAKLSSQDILFDLRAKIKMRVLQMLDEEPDFSLENAKNFLAQLDN
jgi:hypothetical protein